MPFRNKMLSVVFPAYNEEENIENTIKSCIEYLANVLSDFEIICVNDGSEDRTPQIVKELAKSNRSVKLVNHAVNRGYGAALRSGFDNAKNKYIFLMDSDGQFRIDNIVAFLNQVSDNNIVVGYRKNRADSFIRTLNAELYRLYIRVVFGLSLKDPDCAYKVFPRAAYERVKPIKSDGALFSAEFMIRLKKAGYDFVELPVEHYPRLYGEQSGADLRVIIRMFKESWKMRNELRK